MNTYDIRWFPAFWELLAGFWLWIFDYEVREHLGGNRLLVAILEWSITCYLGKAFFFFFSENPGFQCGLN